jgi:hypothetical protein
MKAGKVPAKTDCSEIDRDFSKPPVAGQDAGAATTQGESAVGAPPDPAGNAPWTVGQLPL